MIVRLFVIYSFVLVLAVQAMAGPSTPTMNTEPDFLLTAPTKVSKDLQLEAAFGYVGEADFSNGLGSVSVTRASLAADYSIFRLSYVLSNFSWLDTGAVSRTLNSDSSHAPWNVLQDVTLRARFLNEKLGDNWRYWVNGEMTSSFEDEFPGAVGLGFDGGVAYDLWNGWMLGVSAKTIALSALNKDLFGETEFGIAVATSHRALRSTLQALGFREDALDGSDNIGFSFAFSGASKTYRLSSQNPIYRNGYLSLVRSKVGVYMDYKASDNLTMSIGPEYHYDRKYKLYNSTGSYKSSHRLDNTWGGVARVLWKF
ncbi:hypothetical protein [Pseudodesulfovibrio sediminis]|uniref:Uncharacterized protein n=1 Tax=Pseudodesulfovibrio sediminis TaxID=2810563 RepID=A0ABN6ESS4_9BACT|nr:hypothetical protein [Pseudodesulfovibrio sediminis]BCS88515.1 hypothetical protein PSDVSF_17570 [Pseudodesulfovibrio sediminis]